MQITSFVLSIIAIIISLLQAAHSYVERDTPYRSIVFEKNVSELRSAVRYSYGLCVVFLCDITNDKVKRDQCYREQVPKYEDYSAAHDSLKLVGSLRVLKELDQLVTSLISADSKKLPVSEQGGRKSYAMCTEKVNKFVDFARNQIGLHQLDQDLKDRWRQTRWPIPTAGAEQQ